MPYSPKLAQSRGFYFVVLLTLTLDNISYAKPNSDLICPKGMTVNEDSYGDFGIRKLCIGTPQKPQTYYPEKVFRSGYLWMEEAPVDGGEAVVSRTWSERGELISESKNKGLENCAGNKAFSSDAIVVGYSKGKSFYAFVYSEKKRLRLFYRLKTKGDQKLFGLNKAQTKVKWQQAELHPATGCAFGGVLPEQLPDFSPLASSDVLREATPEEKSRFSKKFSDCVVRGGPDPKSPPCDKKKLTAISDINNDGIQEYWYHAPFHWDDGFGMVEYDVKLDKFYEFAENCDNCSD